MDQEAQAVGECCKNLAVSRARAPGSPRAGVGGAQVLARISAVPYLLGPEVAATSASRGSATVAPKKPWHPSIAHSSPTPSPPAGPRRSSQSLRSDTRRCGPGPPRRAEVGRSSDQPEVGAVVLRTHRQQRVLHLFPPARATSPVTWTSSARASSPRRRGRARVHGGAAARLGDLGEVPVGARDPGGVNGGFGPGWAANALAVRACRKNRVARRSGRRGGEEGDSEAAQAASVAAEREPSLSLNHPGRTRRAPRSAPWDGAPAASNVPIELRAAGAGPCARPRTRAAT